MGVRLYAVCPSTIYVRENMLYGYTHTYMPLLPIPIVVI